MKLKILDVLLIAVMAVGGVLAWRTTAERSRLEAKYARLVRVTGDLTIKDGTKVHILALDTGEPMHFAWRIYLPPKYRQTLKFRRGIGGNTSRTVSEGEFIARVRFRDTDGGQVYTHFGGGSTRSDLGDEKLVKFLHGRWDKVRVEQLGSDHPQTLDANRSAVLLRLELPPEMREEAKKELQRDTPLMFELTLGPKS